MKTQTLDEGPGIEDAMSDTARFRCPHCLEITAFRPAVHEAVFGAESIAPSFISYRIPCKYCRREFLFAVRRPPIVAPPAADVPQE